MSRMFLSFCTKFLSRPSVFISSRVQYLSTLSKQIKSRSNCNNNARFTKNLTNTNPLCIIIRKFSGEPLSIQSVSDRVMLNLRLYDKIDPEKINLDSNLMKDMGLDSLDHVEVIMAIEEEFNFEIPDQEAIRLNTPREIIQYVCDKYDVYD